MQVVNHGASIFAEVVGSPAQISVERGLRWQTPRLGVRPRELGYTAAQSNHVKRMVKTQRVRDPIHDLIVFESDLDQIAWRLLETPEFQRLRRIKQLGVSEF